MVGGFCFVRNNPCHRYRAEQERFAPWATRGTNAARIAVERVDGLLAVAEPCRFMQTFILENQVSIYRNSCH